MQKMPDKEPAVTFSLMAPRCDPSCDLPRCQQVKGDLSDILMGHNTWTSYYTMTRLYKHYDFSGLGNRHAVGRRVSMSSYPGAVSSIDDWYTVGAPTHLHVSVNGVDVVHLLSSVDCVDLSWCRVGTWIGLFEVGTCKAGP